MAVEVGRSIGPPNWTSLTKGDLSFIDLGPGFCLGVGVAAPVRCSHCAPRPH